MIVPVVDGWNEKKRAVFWARIYLLPRREYPGWPFFLHPDDIATADKLRLIAGATEA